MLFIPAFRFGVTAERSASLWLFLGKSYFLFGVGSFMISMCRVSFPSGLVAHCKCLCASHFSFLMMHLECMGWPERNVAACNLGSCCPIQFKISRTSIRRTFHIWIHRSCCRLELLLKWMSIEEPMHGASRLYGRHSGCRMFCKSVRFERVSSRG